MFAFDFPLSFIDFFEQKPALCSSCKIKGSIGVLLLQVRVANSLVGTEASQGVAKCLLLILVLRERLGINGNGFRFNQSRHLLPASLFLPSRFLSMPVVLSPLDSPDE